MFYKRFVYILLHGTVLSKIAGKTYNTSHTQASNDNDISSKLMLKYDWQPVNAIISIANLLLIAAQSYC